MKKNDWIYTGGVAAYSFLFYNQMAGFNFLLFSLLLVALLYFQYESGSQSKSWWFAAVGAVLSGACVMLFGSTVSVIANVIALSLLGAVSASPKSSVFVSLFHSAFSYASAFIFMILDTVKRVENRKQVLAEVNVEEEQTKKRGKWMLYVIPLVLLLVFFSLYRSANPVFDSLTADINFDFVSLSWTLFTISGVLLMYGLFYHQSIREIQNYDAEAPNKLVFGVKNAFDRLSTMANEYQSGIVLFVLLNALLLFLNVVDVNYLYLAAELPEDLNYSDMVHQSVATLIFSIVVAIAVILFYFRGRLNFHPKNRWIKILAFVWIVQNVMLLIATAYRNYLYIEEYSLTHKRIGVYVWLLLTFIGLAVTLIKVLQKRTNWFLIRTTGWSFFAVLMLSSAINWNQQIVSYNVNWAEEKQRPLDMEYLIRLDPTNLDFLLEYMKDPYRRLVTTHGRANHLIEQEVQRFVHDYEATAWQSWSKDRARVYAYLVAAEKANEIRISRWDEE